MNAVVRHVIFLTLAIVAFNQAEAQKASYTTNSGMTIGFGIGASYQQSDIANSRGAGFDFTLGHHIYKKENAFLSVDWKFRFLAGENKAYDHRINPDTTYSNIRLDIINCDLELGLTLNRLRERTRIVVTGFAGAGMTYGSTFTDLYDGNGLLYDYSVIDPNQERAKVYDDLLTLSDGNFETPLINKTAIFPTLGIFIGYQFSRSFMLGIEHKTNFSLSEQNSWDGINIDNDIITGSKKDRIHYTTLSLRWNLRGRSSRSAGGYTSSGIDYTTDTIKPIDTISPVTNPTPVIVVKPPVVDITVPAGSNYSTTVEIIDISARVQNVRNRQDIQVFLNGKNIGFEYNPGTGSIRSTIVLADGKNNLEITGANQAGSVSDNVTIMFNKPVRSALPVIRFINPPGPVTVNRNIFELSVQTFNVNAWQDVTVTVNGINTSNFSLSPEGVVTTNIGLKEGENRVEVSGKNESGVTAEMTTIGYIKPETTKPPVVNFLIPGTDPYNTYHPSQEIRAIITDIKSKENISVYMNGKNLTNFTYDNNSLTLNTSITLNEGRNEITITARNEAGQGAESQIIIKETKTVTETRPVAEPIPCSQPSLRMIAPAQNDLNTDGQSYTFRTEVKNIVSRDQLLLTINSTSIRNFNFKGNELTCTAFLNAGSNSFVLVAKNSCGSAIVTSSILYRPARVITVEEKPCPGPGLNFSVNAINQNDATHELKGFISNVKNRSGITITINDTPFEGFQFVSNTGELGARFKFNPGTHTIKLIVRNECGQVSGSDTVMIKEESTCGPRINPGNASWQFCLVTPSGTFNRESLTNNNFSYSGPASSLFIMPVAGGGDAIVNGRPYNLKPGQYYLFKGTLKVTVSTKNPGSMGQWSVCINSDKEPVFGNGSNRPQSPCEEIKDESTQKKNTPAKEDKPSQEVKKDSTKTGGKK